MAKFSAEKYFPDTDWNEVLRKVIKLDWCFTEDIPVTDVRYLLRCIGRMATVADSNKGYPKLLSIGVVTVYQQDENDEFHLHIGTDKPRIKFPRIELVRDGWNWRIEEGSLWIQSRGPKGRWLVVIDARGNFRNAENVKLAKTALALYEIIERQKPYL